MRARRSDRARVMRAAGSSSRAGTPAWRRGSSATRAERIAVAPPSITRCSAWRSPDHAFGVARRRAAVEGAADQEERARRSGTACGKHPRIGDAEPLQIPGRRLIARRVRLLRFGLDAADGRRSPRRRSPWPRSSRSAGSPPGKAGPQREGGPVSALERATKSGSPAKVSALEHLREHGLQVERAPWTARVCRPWGGPA